MDIITRNLINLLRVLHSETGSYQLAAGFSAGFVLGMTPFFSIQSVLIFFFIILFRIQFGAAFVGAFVFSFVAFLLDPLFHAVGSYFLELESLQGLWTQLYNLPIIPFSRFYNSIVMGSFIVSFLLTPFIFVLSLILIDKYRVVVVRRFKGTALFKAITGSKLYGFYQRYESFYGK